MALYQGTSYTKIFALSDSVSGAALNITDWTFRAMFRDRLESVVALELTTADGGFEVIAPGTDGRLQMAITAEESEDLPLGTVVFDVIRTDQVDPEWLFGGKLKIRQPVTRDE